MVRVFCAYHYRGQTIHTINDDILASCLMENTGHIAIAKSNHIVDIVSLQLNNDENDLNHNDNEKCMKTVLSFPTVDQVLQIIYCCNGNYLVTLEKRSSRRQGEKFFCRVYANWSALDATNGKNASIRARIAGKITPSNCIDCLEVIEIPVRSTPKRVACCQTTGNIAIVVNCGIVFYKYFECTNDSTKHRYIDFKEIPFGVDLDFTPHKLELVEHFVTCLSKKFVIMFRINLSNSLQSDDAISASLTSDISNSCPIESLLNKKIVNDVVDFNVSNVEDFEVAIGSTHDRSEQRKHSICEFKPITTNLKCNLVRQLTDNDMLIHSESDYTLKVLLQLKQRDTNDPFKCLVMKPIFLKRNENTNDLMTEEHIWKSNHLHDLFGVTVVVGTSNDGYVYQFSNNEKWLTEDTNLIATYPFTSPVIDVMINQNVLHALTDRGMETYTLRVGHKLFSSYFEYNLQNASSEIEACPRLEDPICLIGLRPFLGVKSMLCNNFHMVLLASNSELLKKEYDEGSWTIYNMTLPSPENLYKDFEELAKSYVTESSSTYAHLMGEAHVIMRVAKEFANVRFDSVKGTDLIRYESSDCENMFLDSCRKLGDFCVMSENREEYCQAFAYYSMGGLLVTEVYDRGLELKRNEQDKSLTGLVHTIKNMFIKHHRHCSDELGRILTNVRLNRVTFGEELLNLFLIAAPDELAALCLKSQVFRDYMSEKVCEAINTKQDKTNEDKLCLVLEIVRSNKQNEAASILNTFTESSFFDVLTQYWCVLFDSTHIKKTNKHVISFSELTESYLLPSNAPQIQQSLVNIFVYLTIDTKAILIDVMLKLLMDHLASTVGQCGYNTTQLILQVLLESYFYDLYITRRFNGTYSDQSIVNCESIESTTSISCQKCSQQHTQTHSTSATSENCPIEHFAAESMNTDAMKILIRIYLGKLKKAQFEQNVHKDAATDQHINTKGLFKFLQKNIGKLYEHHQAQYTAAADDMELVNEILDHSYRKRPILFLQCRPTYLNRLRPFSENRFLYNEMGHYTLNDADNWSDLHLTILKFQALLSSGRLTRDILQEIVYFFEANAPLISIESFITLLLPDSNCLAFFIENYPSHLLEFAKCRLNDEKENLWTDLLLRILDQKDWLITSNSHKFFEKLLEDILKYIVKTKDLATVLRIIPVKKSEIANLDSHSTTTENVERYEDKIFAEYLKIAIDQDRANRLSDMIKTTGHQLYDTYNRNKQFFN